MLDKDDITRFNAAFPRIPIDRRRSSELPIELDQLARAAEAIRRRLDFDAEIADFPAALIACAEPM